MAAYLPNSGYDYSCPNVCDFENIAQSTSYDVHQSDNYYQKNIESEMNMYAHMQYASAHTHWLQESSGLSTPDRSWLPESQPQMAQYFAQHQELPVNRPPVLSWPMDYFMTREPSFVSTGAGSITDTLGPSSPASSMTPDLLYTCSSGSSVDETSNVFDHQFGVALGSVNSIPEDHSLRPQLVRQGSDSSFICSPSPPRYEMDDPSPSRRRRTPLRTPSPPSESGSSSSSDHRRRFPCLLAGCSRRFTSQYTLKVHMEAHKPKPKVTFPCTHGCSERFSRQHDRLRHEVAKHGKVCEFSCDECGRFFSTSKTLGNHKCPLAPGGTRWVHS